MEDENTVAIHDGIPIGTPITQEVKQFLIQYDPDWEG